MQTLLASSGPAGSGPVKAQLNSLNAAFRDQYSGWEAQAEQALAQYESQYCTPAKFTPCEEPGLGLRGAPAAWGRAAAVTHPPLLHRPPLCSQEDPRQVRGPRLQDQLLHGRVRLQRDCLLW